MTASATTAAASRGGRVCAACSHADRDQIDVDLAAGGESVRSIARRYGMSERSLRRHCTNHRNAELAALTASRPATVARAGQDMDTGLWALLDRCEAFLVAAEQSGNHAAAMSAIREMRGLWELWGKATGAIRERPAVVINLVQSLEWQQLSAELFTVLQEHPAALAAVRAQLRLEAPA